MSRLIRFVLLAAAVIAAVRKMRPQEPQPTYRNTLFWRLYNWKSAKLDRTIGWDKLSTPLGLAVLVGIRNVLRQRNLHDTDVAPTVGDQPLPPFEPRLLTARSVDGTYNDLDYPKMGRAGSRSSASPSSPSVWVERLRRVGSSPAGT